MRLMEDTTEKKRTGTYYTSKEVADFIIKKLIGSENLGRVLEPSVGGGVFVDSIFSSGKRFDSITCVEIDKRASVAFGERYKNNPSVNNVTGDFLVFYRNHSDERFDTIVGNPPYVRYQYLSDSGRSDVAAVLSENGMAPNRLTNLWVPFVVACENMLSEAGVLALVVPAELLQVGYSADLRGFLLERFSSIDVLTFRHLLFPDLQQETVLLVCRKQSTNKGLRVVESESLDSFDMRTLSLDTYVFPTSKEKWTPLLHNGCDKISIPFLPLNAYADISVGVTTGANAYFSVTQDTVKKYCLQRFVKPLLGKSNQARCCYFTKRDHLNNQTANRRADLLVLPDKDEKSFPYSVQEYIDLGIEKKIPKGYKCSIRNHWYSIPSVWYPDLFFQRRCGSNPKLVFNACGAVSTDTMHRVKLKKSVDGRLLTLVFYNSITFASAETEGRSYGGGVLEILPSEAERILVPDLSMLRDVDVQSAFLKVDRLIRENQTYLPVLDFVDQKILIETLGIKPDVVKTFREKWLCLSGRRLARGAIRD